MDTKGIGRALVALTVVTAVGVIAVDAPAETVTLDPCRSISPRSIDSYVGTIEGALRYATTDAKQNGTGGAYAVAATNSRDLLQRALDRANRASDDINGTNPSVTTAAEAGTIKEHMGAILGVVPQAAHWSIISEIYHNSSNARKAFERSIAVLEQGNALFAESGRCYMNGL
ncbi:MAG: hypothetical protein ACR2GQ_02930 [Gemmatimonadota bacterium]|jgi:hypothetical protein